MAAAKAQQIPTGDKPSLPVPPEGPRPGNLPSRRRPTVAAGASPVVVADGTGLASIEVYSVEDCCSKCIEGVSETSTLASLIEQVKYEFAIPGSEELNLSFGARRFDHDDLLMQLGDLGVCEGSILSFEIRQSEFFDVAVTDLAGHRYIVRDLLPEMRLGMLVMLAEKAMSLHDEGVQLIFGTQALVDNTLSRTLGELGIGASCELMALKRLRLQGSCPLCFSGITTSCDVTIGATHEGWGRRWNRCQYNCKRCGSEILHGEPMNTCHKCKCFWHRSCKLAQVPATSC